MVKSITIALMLVARVSSEHLQGLRRYAAWRRKWSAMGSAVPLAGTCWSSSSEFLPNAGLAMVVLCQEDELLDVPSMTVDTFSSLLCACFFSGGRSDCRVTRAAPLLVIWRDVSAEEFLSEAARTGGDADWTASQSSSSPEPDGRLLIERYAHTRDVQASRAGMTTGGGGDDGSDDDGSTVCGVRCGVGGLVSSGRRLRFSAQKRRRRKWASLLGGESEVPRLPARPAINSAAVCVKRPAGDCKVR